MCTLGAIPSQRRRGAREMRRECAAARDGIRGNVHIGATAVAKTAHYLRFSRRATHTTRGSVASPRRGARASAPMCTLGPLPSRPCEELACNVHIGCGSVARLGRRARNSWAMCTLVPLPSPRRLGAEAGDSGDRHQSPHGPRASRTYASGSTTSKVLPWPGADVTSTRPPWSSTTFWTMARPRPLPWVARLVSP